MADVTKVDHFQYPYTDLRFPGMSSDELILFVTRESSLIHKVRLFILFAVVIFGIVVGVLVINTIRNFIPNLEIGTLPVFLVGILTAGLGWWWINSTYKKSVFIITTRRLTKIIYTTPLTWYQFSLGIDEIEDTGSYSASFLASLLGLGYFVARSGAGAIKNFKIINITFSKDLHNYVNKLLYVFKHHVDKIKLFRPFAADLKGVEREEFFKKYPEYQTEFD